MGHLNLSALPTVVSVVRGQRQQAHRLWILDFRIRVFVALTISPSETQMERWRIESAAMDLLTWEPKHMGTGSGGEHASDMGMSHVLHLQPNSNPTGVKSEISQFDPRAVMEASVSRIGIPDVPPYLFLR
jgi:hypothetical protein